MQLLCHFLAVWLFTFFREGTAAYGEQNISINLHFVPSKCEINYIENLLRLIFILAFFFIVYFFLLLHALMWCSPGVLLKYILNSCIELCFGCEKEVASRWQGYHPLNEERSSRARSCDSNQLIIFLKTIQLLIWLTCVV